MPCAQGAPDIFLMHRKDAYGDAFRPANQRRLTGHSTHRLRRDGWLLALWILQAGLITMDHIEPNETSPLKAYFLLPVLIAGAFAAPRQVAALGAVALVGCIASAVQLGHLGSSDFQWRLFAGMGITAVAVIFAKRHQAAERNAALVHTRLQAILDNLFDLHVMMEPVRGADGSITDFVFTEANGAACAYHDSTRDALLGRRLLEVMPRGTSDGLFEKYRTALEGDHRLSLQNHPLRAGEGGGIRYYDIHAIELGRNLSCTWHDVTERHLHSEQLAHLARTDTLTQLTNRREFLERLHDLQYRTPRHGSLNAVLFIDIDRFKELNDICGHAAGDEVLRMTASRIRSCLRHDDDLAGRVGGDEMIVVLHGVNSLADALTVAEKLRASATQPINFNGTPMETSVSIGVALASPDESPMRLMARADTAMYQAKQGGRNRFITVDSPPPAFTPATAGRRPSRLENTSPSRRQPMHAVNLAGGFSEG